MLKVTRTILFDNIIECNNKLFLQKNGLAMGINYAPSLANIYLFHKYDLLFAKSLYSKSIHNPILFYGRYLDDILIIHHKKWNINGYVKSTLNKVHPSIQFTTEQNDDNVINFLDLTVSLNCETNEIDHKNYAKPLKVNTMLHAKAAFKQKPGLIKSQSIRLLKNNRLESDYNNDIEQLSNELQTRGYKKQLINDNIEPFQNRSTYMDKYYKLNKPDTFAEKNKNKKRIVLDYHNRINTVKKAITKVNKDVYFINRNYSNLYNTFFSNRKNTRLKWSYQVVDDTKYTGFKFTKQPSTNAQMKRRFQFLRSKRKSSKIHTDNRELVS